MPGHLFLGELHCNLLFLALSQYRERDVRAVGESLQQLSQLAGFNQNLVIQQFKDVVLLNACRGGRTIRHHIFNNQPETFDQPTLFTYDIRNLRRLHAKKRRWHLRRFLVMTGYPWRPMGARRRWRWWWRRRRLGKSHDGQDDGCNCSDGFCFHGFCLLNHWPETGTRTTSSLE